MNHLYKLIPAIAVACCIGPVAFVVWFAYELSKCPDIFDVESPTFEEMSAA